MSCKWCKKQCLACQLWPHGRTAAETSVSSLPFFLRWLMWWDMVPNLLGFGLILATVILDFTVGLSRWWANNSLWFILAFVALLYLVFFVVSVRRAKVAKQAEVDYRYESLITNLRKLGGVWTSQRIGFGNYRYQGEISGHTFEVYSQSQPAPKFEGDDATVSRWHIKIDGSEYWYSSGFDPIGDIKEWLEEQE